MRVTPPSTARPSTRDRPRGERRLDAARGHGRAREGQRCAVVAGHDEIRREAQIDPAVTRGERVEPLRREDDGDRRRDRGDREQLRRARVDEPDEARGRREVDQGVELRARAPPARAPWPARLGTPRGGPRGARAPRAASARPPHPATRMRAKRRFFEPTRTRCSLPGASCALGVGRARAVDLDAALLDEPPAPRSSSSRGRPA